MSPNEVTAKNVDIVWYNSYKDLLSRPAKKALYVVDQKVRIDRQKAMFEKGHSYSWNPEVFIVDKVVLNRPVTYELRDLRGEKFLGKFYLPELKAVHDE